MAIDAGLFHVLQFDYYEREIRQNHCLDTIYNFTKCSIAVVLQQTTHSIYKRDVTRRIDPLCHLPQPQYCQHCPPGAGAGGQRYNGPIIEQSRASSLSLISIIIAPSRPGSWATAIKEGRIDNILIVFPRIEDREDGGW